ncbi:MFS transporter [Rathayibacter sp. CAU 1779]
MIARRALLKWQLVAVPVLPLWLMVGFGVFGGSGGFFLLFLGAGVLFLFLGALAGLTRLRPAVRADRAVGWWDVAATVAFHLAVIGLGFFGATGVAFGLAAVVLGLATFWLTVWQLMREWRERVSGAMAQASSGYGTPQNRRPPPEDLGVIVVHETGH